jgi:hypothetical protein
MESERKKKREKVCRGWNERTSSYVNNTTMNRVFRTVDERAIDLGYRCSSICFMKLARSCRSKDKEK